MNHLETIKGPTRRGAGRLAMLTLAAAGVLASSPASPQQGDDDQDGEARDCVNLMSIDRTRVVDDDTILFFMRGGDVYRNDLANRCPNLDADERFMYRVTLSRLCDVDVITVLDDVGFGFVPGASCGLGKFRPISEDEAEDLTERRRDRD